MKKQRKIALSVDQVAKRLGLNRRTAYRWAESGKLPGATIIDMGDRRAFFFNADKIAEFEKSFVG